MLARARRLAGGLLALSVACGGVASPGGSTTGSSVEPRCEVRFTMPAGFALTGTHEEPAPDHLGVRIDLRDDRGRELHVFAGVEGEFGEGAPVDGPVRLATGQETWLLGEGETWTLAWVSSGPCATNAVIGNGFTRDGFVLAMVEAGVVTAGPAG